MTDAPVDDSPPHDPQAIERLRKWGGAKLVREMVDLFLHDVPGRLAAAREALQNGHRDEFERFAHSIKSSAAQLGAPRLQRFAREAEVAAADGATTHLAPLLERMETAFAEHAAWLRTYPVENAS